MSFEDKSWPQFVGKDAAEVQSQLATEGYAPEVLPEGSPTTRDYRIERVRLFVDAKNKIVQEPRTG